MIICLRTRARCLVIRTRDPIKEDGAYCCPHLPSLFFFLFSSPPPPQLSKMTPNLNSSLLAHPFALGQGHRTLPPLFFANFSFSIYPFPAAPRRLPFFLPADPKSAPSAHWAKAAPYAASHDRGRPKRGADPMICIDRVKRAPSVKAP